MSAWGVCEAEGCEQRIRWDNKTGLCVKHAEAAYSRTKGKENLEKRTYPPCEVEGCPEKANRRGLCEMHRTRLERHGDPGEVERRHAEPCTPTITPQGYRKVCVPGTTKMMLEHRVVMAEIIGRPLRPDENVHHKNGDRLDNRPENLELWTKGQPSGQRVEDLVRFICDNYPDTVRTYMDGAA